MARRKTATEIVREETGAVKRYESYMLDLAWEENALMQIRKMALEEAMRFMGVGCPEDALEAMRVYDAAGG